MTSAADRSVRADAVIVAAGGSTRMGGIDKLTALVGGQPLLAWAIRAFDASVVVERIVVVMAPERIAWLRAARWLPPKVADIVAGGGRRQESVAAGLASLERLGIDDQRIVLVHDGARPVVGPDLIDRIAAAAAEHGVAVPVLPITDTVKRIDDDLVVETLDRSSLATAQTPQAARRAAFRQALDLHPADGSDTWTDEAALFEACRIPVHAVPGDPENLKVTLPADLARAAAVLAGPDAGRLGYGTDRHPFGPGAPLVLGGIEFAGVPRLHGHSDGDVALHAVADALLGAASLGDLGRMFPSDARTPEGIASTQLLDAVVGHLAAAGFRATSVDLTITAARPRLAARLDEMRDALAARLGLTTTDVSIKASSGNLDGMEGAGRGVSAAAVATVARTGTR